MPKFGKNSRANLAQADPRLQQVFSEVIKHFDCSIVEGHRPQARQDQMFDQGLSKLKWPNSKHNSKPSRAVDAVPYPSGYRSNLDMAYFAGFVMATAAQMGIKLRFGGDWNGNNELSDEQFLDLAHFELVE